MCVIGEIPPALNANVGYHNLGAAVKVGTMDHNGLKVHTRIGTKLPSAEPGSYIGPHGIAVDSRGDIYVGEVSYAIYPQMFKADAPKGLRSLSKLVKI
jgi:hypothetical protein